MSLPSQEHHESRFNSFHSAQRTLRRRHLRTAGGLHGNPRRQGWRGRRGRLWQTAAALPVRATVEVDLPRGKQGLKARTATLAVRAGRVRLEVPAHKKKYLGLEGSLDLWAIEVLEANPPQGVEPVCWRC